MVKNTKTKLSKQEASNDESDYLMSTIEAARLGRRLATFPRQIRGTYSLVEEAVGDTDAKPDKHTHQSNGLVYRMPLCQAARPQQDNAYGHEEDD